MHIYVIRQAALGFLFEVSSGLDHADQNLDAFLTHISCQRKERQLQHMRNRIYGLIKEVKELENEIEESLVSGK